MPSVLACSAPTAAQQEWPTRFITMIVPFGTGSASDTVARIFAPQLSEILGQQVVIENVGGAGGTIGSSRAAKAAPDGYTIVMGAIDTFAQSQSLSRTRPTTLSPISCRPALCVLKTRFCNSGDEGRRGRAQT
jgi:tripartite-type tricarboxylate transporter receptor subunit TctC